MIMKVLSMFDKKLGVYANPVYEKNIDNAEIVEGYRRMCANPKLPVGYFDFDVYLLGTFDDKTGEFNASKPEFLCSLGDYRHLAAIKEEKVNEQSA